VTNTPVHCPQSTALIGTLVQHVNDTSKRLRFKVFAWSSSSRTNCSATIAALFSGMAGCQPTLATQGNFSCFDVRMQWFSSLQPQALERRARHHGDDFTVVPHPESNLHDLFAAANVDDCSAHPVPRRQQVRLVVDRGDDLRAVDRVATHVELAHHCLHHLTRPGRGPSARARTAIWRASTSMRSRRLRPRASWSSTSWAAMDEPAPGRVTRIPSRARSASAAVRSAARPTAQSTRTPPWPRSSRTRLWRAVDRHGFDLSRRCRRAHCLPGAACASCLREPVRDRTQGARPARLQLHGGRGSRSVETSLSRIGLDHIPVIYIHDPSAAIFDRVMGPGGALVALRQLQSEGVLGHIGIASNNPWDRPATFVCGNVERTSPYCRGDLGESRCALSSSLLSWPPASSPV
jgi:hypothetical protein